MTCSLILVRSSYWQSTSSLPQQLDNSSSTQMATECQERFPVGESFTTIELLTPKGPDFRRVSTAPARQPRDDEIPVIDLTGLDGDLEARNIIAEHVRKAAENTGFFYVQNYGIDEGLIEDALSQAKAFFAQPAEQKELLSPRNIGFGVGYRGVSSTQINRTESRGGSPLARCKHRTTLTDGHRSEGNTRDPVRYTL